MDRTTELYTMEDEELDQELQIMHDKLGKCMSGQADLILMICKNIETIREVQRSRALERLGSV